MPAAEPEGDRQGRMELRGGYKRVLVLLVGRKPVGEVYMHQVVQVEKMLLQGHCIGPGVWHLHG